MNRRKLTFAVGIAVAAMTMGAWAQTPKVNTIAQPDYMSGASAGAMTAGNWNSPEADARPGWKFFNEGMQSYKEGDVTHAIYMLKLAAYWAYEPAAYNLGVMYFQGENVATDRPLGTAWMFIAAQGGSAVYMSARHVMVQSLDGTERTQALADYDELQRKYGAAAGRRAGAQWAYVKTQATGSRTGAAGTAELRVGLPASANTGTFHTSTTGPGGQVPNGSKSSALQVLAAGTSQDGSIAYRQFTESSNPYSPIFLKNRTGKATVGPLRAIDQDERSSRPSPASATSTGTPQHH